VNKHEKMIQLEKGKNRALIDERKGGRLAQLFIGDLSILVEEEENPLAWGCYPMAPWVGRLEKGLWRYQWKDYRFPINLEPHAIHGTCFTRPWHIEKKSENSVSLSIDLGEHWPFAGRARQTISLENDTLMMELSVSSESESFPASLGWHPWFKRQLEQGEALELFFEAQNKYACDQTQIPTSELIPPGSPPWDDCFTEVTKKPLLRWNKAAKGKALEVEIESDCDHWVVYNMPEHALCVEPQTSAANAINENRLPVDIVSPEEALTKTMALHWRLI
jgi:aldose 1-epimerase